MKKTLNHLFKTVAILLLIGFSYTGIAQGPPPPPDSGSSTTGNKLGGNGAPIGSGLFILLGLGAAYGGKKLYQIKKQMIKEEL